MFKRIWIVLVAVLATGVLLSACGGGDLAEDLTPIPTLPPGEEPELRDELQGGVEVAVLPADEGDTVVAGDEADDGEPLDEAQLVTMGGDLFASLCASCHGAQDGAGPAFLGMAERAAMRVAGMSAENYLYQSIVDPSAYVVEGFADFMPPSYGDDLSDVELQAVVTYIMVESGGAADAAMGDEDVAEDAAEADAGADEVETGDAEEVDEAEATVGADEEAAGDEGEAAAVAVGDAANGEAIFAPACGSCHGPEDSLGPAIVGMGERAATRVDGLSAEDYLYEAIVDPGAYVVEDFVNMMPPSYGDTYSEQELQDIIAFILTQ